MSAAAPSRAISAGGYSRPLPGFVECGDVFVIELLEREPAGALLVGVVDGLGHGNEASVAAHFNPAQTESIKAMFLDRDALAAMPVSEFVARLVTAS